MTKWLIRLIALLLLVAAGLYWRELSVVNDRLDRLATELAEFGQLSWKSVVIDTRGRAVVGDLSFQPDQAPDTIRIKVLAIDKTALAGLFATAPGTEVNAVAERWSVGLGGVRLPLGPMVADWSLEWLGLMLPFRASACTGFEHPTLGDLIQLGYGRIEFDARLNIQADEGRLRVDLELDVRDLSESLLSWELIQSQPVRSLEELPGLLATAALRALDYRIEDRGLLSRLDSACTALSATRQSEAIDPRFRSWLRAWTDLGLEPGGIVQAGFRHHLEQPAAAVSFSARPERAIPVSDLRDSLDPNTVEALNLSFAIADGTSVSLATQVVASTREAPAPAPTNEETVSILRSENNIESTIIVGRSPDWASIPLSALSDHLGDRVRIDFIDGTQLTGQIAGLDDDQLELLTQSRMGEFIRPIPLTDILAIEVRP